MSEYTNKTKEELVKLVAAKRAAIRAFHIARLGGRVKNVKEAHNARKDIARILTAVNAQ